MVYKVRITNDAINDVYTFYGNAIIAYPNTWTRTNATSYADAIIDEMASSIIDGLSGERAPLLTNLRSRGVAELYTRNRQWYYTVRLQDGFAIIENAVYTRNESNRAYRRGMVSPTAPLSLDDRRNQVRMGTPPAPTTNSISLSSIRILNGSYYNGLRIAYNNHKYTIVQSNGSPLTNKWFDKKPKFFKKPFGQYNIIAHVSYYGSLYAVDINGNTYDMHKLWDDVYLSENVQTMLDYFISESIRKHLHHTINESNTNVIKINEQQLREAIIDIVNTLVA